MKNKKAFKIAGIVFIIIACWLVFFFILFPKERTITITFGMFAGNQWDVPNDDCYKIIDEAIEEFEEEYPNAKIKYVSGILKDDYSEWISEHALNGELPDVFMVLPEDFNTFSSVGLLKNLDSLIASDDSFHPDEYYSGCYEAGELQNSQYALPYESVPTLMFVNQTLLEKENIPLPDEHWTWDDFYEICRKLTRDTDGDGQIDQFGVYDYSWRHSVYSNGAGLFSEDGKQCKLMTNSIQNAILFARKIQQLYGYQSPSSEDFDTGKISFRPMTFSEFRTYKPYPYKLNKYFNFQWDCIRLPAGPDGENMTYVDNLLIGISNKTRHSKLAWEFLKKLTYREETQKRLFRYSQGISPLKKVTNSEDTEKALQESMGKDSGMKVSLLDDVLEHTAETEKFRNYDTIMDYMDGEIMKLFSEDVDFDEEIQKLKRNIDRMLNE